MMFDIFIFDGDEISINKPEVLMIREFDAVWNNTDFGKCKDDKTGKKHVKAMSFFKYLWLAHDYKSDYQELDEETRIQTAVADSGLDIKDIQHGIAIAAIRKYNQLQETRLLKMLRTANNSLDKVDQFLNNMDLYEKDPKDNYVHSVNDVFKQLSQIGGIASSLKDLEYQVKKEKDAESAIRGEDTEEGFFD